MKFFRLTSGISRLIIFVRLRWKPQNVKGAILMKKMLALVLALAMCLGCAALAEETALVYALGAPMPDFTFTDINGVSHTLSETLKEKEMVLINLWATWCGP